MSSNCTTPSDKDDWITGAALETVIALDGIQAGDWIRHAPNCVSLSITPEWVGKGDRVAKVTTAKGDIVTEEGWYTDVKRIDGWKPGKR